MSKFYPAVVAYRGSYITFLSPTTKAVNYLTAWVEVYPIQIYMIKFVSDLEAGQWFNPVLYKFPPATKLTATEIL